MRPPLHPAAAQARAAALPDRPVWLEAKAILCSGRARVIESRPPGYVLWDPLLRLAVATERPALDDVRRVVAELEDGEFLAPPGEGERLLEALPGWQLERAVLHLKASPPTPGRPTGALRTLSAADDLSAFAGWVGLEVATAAEGDAVGATVDGAVAAVCVTSFVTERYWDVGVETLPAFRRRGLASECFRELERRQALAGRGPVWGAHESNRASLVLAAKLGFEPAGTIEVLSAEPAAGDESADPVA